MSESWSLERYRAHVEGKDKKSKYRNEKVTIDGITFDSKAEAAYYNYLLILRENKEVSHFLMQVPFVLDAGVKYRLDFLVFYAGGRVDYVDIKGAVTKEFKIKKKQVEYRYPVKIRCLKKQGNRFIEISVGG